MSSGRERMGERLHGVCLLLCDGPVPSDGADLGEARWGHSTCPLGWSQGLFRADGSVMPPNGKIYSCERASMGTMPASSRCVNVTGSDRVRDSLGGVGPCQSRAREEAVVPVRPLPHGRGSEKPAIRWSADSVTDPKRPFPLAIRFPVSVVEWNCADTRGRSGEGHESWAPHAPLTHRSSRSSPS